MNFISPSQLVFCLILFFLPWIEVQCVPKAGAQKGPAVGIGGVGKPPPVNPFDGPGGMEFGGAMAGPQPLLSQSGLQIAMGSFSIANPMLTDEINQGRPKDGGTGAPLLFLFPVVVLIGAVIGFIPIAGMGRKIGLLLCCLVALAVVGGQAAMGFPIKKSIEEDKQRSQKLGGGGMNDPSMELKVAWQIPLYLTFILLISAAGTAFLGGGKSAAKKRRRFEDDDNDRDEQDDRPRRRARPDDDDDDDDDDAPPRRRARRDDD